MSDSTSGTANSLPAAAGSTQLPAAGGQAGPSAPAPVMVAVLTPPRVGDVPCWTTTLVPVGTVVVPWEILMGKDALRCPAAAAPPAPPPPTATEVAASWAANATLPAPTLTVRPGYVVTGLTAYLEIKTPDPWTAAFNDPIRADVISVTCAHTTFDVAWGDGATTHTTSVGGPYPDGTVTHLYDNATPRTALAVTEHWTCRWADHLGNSGVIGDLRSVGRRDLEVREIQVLGR